MRKNPTMYAYAALSILGAVAPWFFAGQVFLSGAGLWEFISLAFANDASSAVCWDITLSSFVFWIWVATESKKHGMRHWWVYVALTFVALATALGVFLMVREKHRTA